MRKIHCWIPVLLLIAGIFPLHAGQQLTSSSGPLLKMPVREFSFTDLSLAEVLEVLYIKAGVQFGIGYSSAVPTLSQKRSGAIGKTTLRGVLMALQEIFPEYQLTYFPRAVVALPKDMNASHLNWLTEDKVEYSCKNVSPNTAIKELLSLPALVGQSDGTLPPSLIRSIKPQSPQTDFDGDRLLVTRSYKDNSPLDILNDLAFSTGLNWTLVQDDGIAVIKGRYAILLPTPIDNNNMDKVVITVPRDYSVRFGVPRRYSLPLDELVIKHLHVENLSIIEIMNILCSEQGFYCAMILPSAVLTEPLSFDCADSRFTDLLQQLLVNNGFTYQSNNRTGMLRILPIKRDDEYQNTMAVLNSEVKQSLTVQPDLSTAVTQINEYLNKELREQSLIIEGQYDDILQPFTMRIPWKAPFSQLDVICSLARKVKASVIIEPKDGRIKVRIVTKFKPKEPGILIVHYIPRSMTYF